MQKRIVGAICSGGVLLCLCRTQGAIRPAQAASHSRITHVRLPFPPMGRQSEWGPSGQVSPNGRWLAYFDARSRNGSKVVFCDLAGSHYRTIGAGSGTGFYGTAVLSWRPDSQACAAGVDSGWHILWPATRQVRRITHTGPGSESCAAWSPRSDRLAIFEGGDRSGLFRVWDGKRLTQGIPWAKAVGYPYGEERAWQCEWSPDEKQILFRFYGHAERDSYAAGHTAILNPRTGRPLFKWGAEAGPARWLDKHRLTYKSDDDGTGSPSGLMVDRPVSGQSNLWLKNTAAWTLSAERKTIWALTMDGSLYRTPAASKRWQLVRRNATAAITFQTLPSLSISPRGDMVAVWAKLGGTSISLISTDKRQPWISSWRSPVGKVKVLGWAKGQSLPLVEIQRNDEAPRIVAQLTKRAG